MFKAVLAKRTILVGLGLLLLLVGLWLFLSPSSPFASFEKRIDDAKQKWQSLNMKSYNIEMQVLEGYFKCNVKSSVRNGQLISKVKTCTGSVEDPISLYTIPDLFREARDHVDVKDDPYTERLSRSNLLKTIKMEFDPKYGFPEIDVDGWRIGVSDMITRIKVPHFEVLN